MVRASDAALRLKPDDETIWAQRLYNFSYHPDLSAQGVHHEFKRWGQRSPDPVVNFSRHDRTPAARLRQATSPRLRANAPRATSWSPCWPGTTTVPWRVYAYAELAREDAVTARCKGYVDHWVPT